MEKCEMARTGAAYMYEQVGSNSVFVCPLNEKLCLYHKVKREFRTKDEEILSVCGSEGLVKKAGLIDTEDPEIKKYIPHPRFSDKGIVVNSS